MYFYKLCLLSFTDDLFYIFPPLIIVFIMLLCIVLYFSDSDLIVIMVQVTRINIIITFTSIINTS